MKRKVRRCPCCKSTHTWRDPDGGLWWCNGCLHCWQGSPPVTAEEAPMTPRRKGARPKRYKAAQEWRVANVRGEIHMRPTYTYYGRVLAERYARRLDERYPLAAPHEAVRCAITPLPGGRRKGGRA